MTPIPLHAPPPGIDPQWLELVEHEFRVYTVYTTRPYGPQLPADIVRYKLAIQNLVLAVPLLLSEIKRLQSEQPPDTLILHPDSELTDVAQLREFRRELAKLDAERKRENDAR